MDTESDLQLSHISDMPSNCSPNTNQYKVHTNRAMLQLGRGKRILEEATYFGATLRWKKVITRSTIWKNATGAVQFQDKD